MKRKLLFITLLFSILGFNTYAQNGLPENLQDRSFMIEYFQTASQEFDVPIAILEGIAFVETHWVQRIPDTTHREGNMPPAFGVMGLRDDSYFGYSLIKAANLIHESPKKLKTDALSNIRGAAALLREYANQEIKNNASSRSQSAPFDELKDWKNVIEKYSGIPQPDIAEVYSYGVYRLLSKGYHAFGIQIKRELIAPQLLEDPLKEKDDFEIYP